MKPIPNWQNQNLRCYFCASTKSVKYTVWVTNYYFHVEKPCCSKCALRFDGGKNNE